MDHHKHSTLGGRSLTSPRRTGGRGDRLPLASTFTFGAGRRLLRSAARASRDARSSSVGWYGAAFPVVSLNFWVFIAVACRGPAFVVTVAHRFVRLRHIYHTLRPRGRVFLRSRLSIASARRSKAMATASRWIGAALIRPEGASMFAGIARSPAEAEVRPFDRPSVGVGDSPENGKSVIGV
jgi:hypothetical protein